MIEKYSIERISSGISSSDPAPGGGVALSISAFLALSAILKATKFTLKDLNVNQKSKLNTIKKDLETYRKKFLKIADKDCDLFLE